MLGPRARGDVHPTPHQHLGEAVAETANRNRNVYPVRELRLGSSPAGVAVSVARHVGIEARPAAEGKREVCQLVGKFSLYTIGQCFEWNQIRDLLQQRNIIFL